MATDNIDELIALHLCNEINDEQELELQQWIASSPDNQKHFDAVKQIWLSAGDETDFNPDVEKAYAKVSAQLNLHEASKVIKMKSSKSQNWVLKIAASLVVLLGFGWFLLYQGESQPQNIQFATNGNEIKELILPDGSKVSLNKDSRISYPEKFTGETREIELEGEAFFEIKKDPKHTFIIHSGKTYTKVLGTSFNVSARKNSQTVVVSVVTGKVELGINDGVSVRLEKGFTGSANLQTSKVEKLVTASDNYLSWKTGMVAFNDVLISDVILFIENYYQVEVNINNEISQCHFTGSFEKPELSELLNVLQLSNGISYNINNNVVTLKGEGCILN